MRIVKEHCERQNEILDTAQKLFVEKGYGACTVNDILHEVGIAKGTFYHYFKSKEEVLDAIIERTAVQVLEKVQAVAVDGSLSPEEKLLHIFLSMRVSEEMGAELLEEMHQPENALMHQKSMTSIVTLTVPVIAKVVLEGNKKGIFACEYPEEYMQIFLASALTLLDGGMFEIEPEKQQSILQALMTLLGKMLGIKEERIMDKIMEYWN